MEKEEKRKKKRQLRERIITLVKSKKDGQKET